MTWEYNLFLSCVSETFKDYSSVTYHIMLWKNLSGYVTQPRNPQSSLPLLIRPRESTHKERTRRKTEKLHRRCLTGISNSLQSTYNEMERRDGVWWFYTMGFWWSPQKSNDWHKNPKSLTMALLYLFWFNITNNNTYR